MAPLHSGRKYGQGFRGIYVSVDVDEMHEDFEVEKEMHVTSWKLIRIQIKTWKKPIYYVDFRYSTLTLVWPTLEAAITFLAMTFKISNFKLVIRNYLKNFPSLLFFV